MKPFEESSDDWDVIGNVDVPRAQIPEAKPQNRLPGLIMNQMERTLNLMQRALNLVEDQIPISSQPPRPPLADAEFRKFLDPIGQVVQSRELRNVIYFGGIEPSLRCFKF
jgi:TBC1 domain family member 25